MFNLYTVRLLQLAIIGLASYNANTAPTELTVISVLFVVFWVIITLPKSSNNTRIADRQTAAPAAKIEPLATKSVMEEFYPDQIHTLPKEELYDKLLHTGWIKPLDLVDKDNLSRTLSIYKDTPDSIFDIASFAVDCEPTYHELLRQCVDLSYRPERDRAAVKTVVTLSAMVHDKPIPKALFDTSSNALSLYAKWLVQSHAMPLKWHLERTPAIKADPLTPHAEYETYLMALVHVSAMCLQNLAKQRARPSVRHIVSILTQCGYYPTEIKESEYPRYTQHCLTYSCIVMGIGIPRHWYVMDANLYELLKRHNHLPKE
jgi:hypothetical protein